MQEALQRRALDGIRGFLLEARRPSDIHKDTWQVFRSYLRHIDHVQLLTFIQAFEWSTGTPQVQELRQDHKQRLIDKGHAIDLLEAEAQYLRLLLHVFDPLSSPGIKPLRREDLEHLIRQPTLSATDHAKLETLREMTTQLEERLQAVEGRVGEVEEGLANMSMQIHRLIRDQGVEAAVSYTLSTPVLDIPSPGQYISRAYLASREGTQEFLTTISTH